MPLLEQLATFVAAVARGLRSGRGLLAVAVVTLTMAIAANLAIFSLVDRALLSPARLVTEPDDLFQLVLERTGHDGRPQRMATTSYPNYERVRDEVPSIAGAAAWQIGPTSVVVGQVQLDAVTHLVTRDYLELLGVTPAMGPSVLGREPGAAVISHRFWRSVFGGGPDALGRTFTVRGIPFHVAAVMPPAFSGHSPAAVDAWLPLEEALQGTPGWDNALRNIVSIVARVPPGELPRAAAEAGAALERTVVLQPLAGSGVGAQERLIAFWLAGVSAVVLLLGLANAGTLLLVRSARRRREFAIRGAIGASRPQLLALLTGEAIVVAVLSVVLAALLAAPFDSVVRGLLLPDVVPIDGFRGLTLLVASFAGLAAGTVALLAGIANLPRTVRDPELARPRIAGLPLQRGLLVMQGSLSVLLLIGAALFGRSLYALLDQDFGFTTDRVVVVDFEPGPAALPDQDGIYLGVLERLRRMPGIEVATVYASMPFGAFNVPPIAVPGRAEPPAVGEQLPFLLSATPEFLSILGIRIIDGRSFSAADASGAPVVIVNETMARGVWPGERAVGKCIRIGFDPDFDPFTATGPPTPSAVVPCREVVGVARDVRQRSVIPEGNEARLMQYYVPFGQAPRPPLAAGSAPSINGLLLETRREGHPSLATLRQELLNGRTDLPPARVRTYASILDRQVRPWKLGTTLFAMFGALAVAIAAAGLYAAFAHAVVIRQREMAIRIAVGATPGSVRMLMLRDALLITMVAALVGAVAGVAAGRWLQSLLYGIVPLDPVALGGAVATMLTVTAAATWFPARAAARSDPTTLLRD